MKSYEKIAREQESRLQKKVEEDAVRTIAQMKSVGKTELSETDKRRLLQDLIERHDDYANTLWTSALVFREAYSLGTPAGPSRTDKSYLAMQSNCYGLLFDDHYKYRSP